MADEGAEEWDDPSVLLNAEAIERTLEEAQVEEDNFEEGDRPVALYLREVRSIPLLSREDEVELGRQIEEGQARILEEVLSTPLAWRCVIEFGEKVESGELRPQDVLLAAAAGSSGESKQRALLLKQVARLRRFVQAHSEVARKLQTAGLSRKNRDCLEKSLCRKRKEILQALIELKLAKPRIEELTEKVKACHPRLLESQCKVQGPANKRGNETALEIRQIETASQLTTEELHRHAQAILEAEAEINQAKKSLTEGNVRLVISIAKKYINRGVPFLDLVQEGNIGLMTAARRFDYRLGYRFSTYATWSIRNAIARAVCSAGVIHIPVHVAARKIRIDSLRSRLVQKFQRDPSPDELAAESGLPKRLLGRSGMEAEALPLQGPIGDAGGITLSAVMENGDGVNTSDRAVREILREQIHKALAVLSPREQRVVRLRFGLGESRDYSLVEVGEKFSISRERVRQIEERAICKLRLLLDGWSNGRERTRSSRESVKANTTINRGGFR